MTRAELIKILKNNHSNFDLNGWGLRSIKDLSDLNLSYTNFINVDLSSVNFCDSNLNHSNMLNVDLTHSILKNTNLSSSDLSHSDLSHCNASNSNFRNTNLSYTKLCSMNLYYASLNNSNLHYSDLSGTDLSRTDLSGTNLTGCKLEYTILEGAYLENTTGNMKELKSLFLETYPVCYTSTILQIGCEQHKIADWWNFSNSTITAMGGRKALKFWRKYKDFIRMTIELSPAIPTKGIKNV